MMRYKKDKLSEVDKQVILAMAECNLNASEVARRSVYHHNTIQYHLESIKTITGLDPRNFHDFLKLYRMARVTAGKEDHENRTN